MINVKDQELIDFAIEEQFLLFCDEDDFIQISRAVLDKFGAQDLIDRGRKQTLIDMANRLEFSLSGFNFSNSWGEGYIQALKDVAEGLRLLSKQEVYKDEV